MPFAPLYIRELGAKEVEFWSALFVAGASVSLMIMSPVWGALGDRYGRRLMLLRANLGGAATLFAMGCVDGVGWLVALRVLQGLFTGTVPAAQTLVSVHTPEAKHGMAMGVLTSAMTVGGMLGPVGGGFVAEAWGPAAGFRIAGGLLLFAALVVALFVREPAVAEPEAESSAVDPAAFRRAVLPVLAAMAGVEWVRNLDAPVFPLFVAELAGEADAYRWTGLIGGVAAFVATLGVLGAGRLLDRHGPARLARWCLVGAAASCAATAAAGGVGLLFPARAGLAFFSMALAPVLQVALGRATDRESRGAAFGWAVTARAAGWIAGPLAGGLVAGAWGTRAVFPFAAFAFLLLLPLWRREAPTSAPASSPTGRS